LNRQFALIGGTGETRVQERFPYMKHQRDTEKYGYACTAPGKQDRHGGGDYTDDIKKVIRRVRLEGYTVRAKEDKALLPAGAKVHAAAIGVGQAVRNYGVAANLRYLVEDADIPPLDELPPAGEQRSARRGSSPVRLSHTVDRQEAQAEIDADERYHD